MSNMQSLAERMAESPDRPARVLDAVTALRRITDGEMATLTGWSRPTIHSKRRGSVRIKPPDVPALSAALDLPMTVFTMTVPEALRWIADNRPEWFSEGDDDDPGDAAGADGGEVVELSSRAGVVQWDCHPELAIAA